MAAASSAASASHSSFRTRFRCFKRPPANGAEPLALRCTPNQVAQTNARAQLPRTDGLRRKLSTRMDSQSVGQLHCWFARRRKSTLAAKKPKAGRPTDRQTERPSSTLTLMTIPIRRDPTPPPPPPPQREMDFGRSSQWRKSTLGVGLLN